MARASTRTGGAPRDERTVRLARKQFARRQWARRWLAWRGVVVLLLVAAVLAGAAWLVYFSSVLVVKGVRVEGLDVLDRAGVVRVAAVPMGEPLATVPLDEIEARVESLAPVKSADVVRSWPNQIRIAVRERRAVAVVDRDGVVRGLDDEGVLFRTYPSLPRRLPVVRISAGTRADALAEAAQVVAALPAGLAAKVDHVSVETVDSISLEMRNGRSIFWGSAAESEEKAAVIRALLRQKASVYDVSVPGQPTIRR